MEKSKRKGGGGKEWAQGKTIGRGQEDSDARGREEEVG